MQIKEQLLKTFENMREYSVQINLYIARFSMLIKYTCPTFAGYSL